MLTIIFVPMSEFYCLILFWAKRTLKEPGACGKMVGPFSI